MNITDEPSHALIVAQTLIDLATLGFVILIAMIGLPQAKSLIILKKDMVPAFELLLDFKYIVIAKITSKRSIGIFTFCALLLITSAILSLLFIILYNNIFLSVGCVFSFISLSLMFIYIVLILTSTHLQKLFLSKSDIAKIIEYIKSNEG